MVGVAPGRPRSPSSSGRRSHRWSGRRPIDVAGGRQPGVGIDAHHRAVERDRIGGCEDPGCGAHPLVGRIGLIRELAEVDERRAARRHRRSRRARRRARTRARRSTDRETAGTNPRPAPARRPSSGCRSPGAATSGRSTCSPPRPGRGTDRGRIRGSPSAAPCHRSRRRRCRAHRRMGGSGMPGRAPSRAGRARRSRGRWCGGRRRRWAWYRSAVEHPE